MGKRKYLLRRHIQKLLSAYYAQPQDKVIGSPVASISLSSLLGKYHWQYIYNKLYKNQRGQWLTPTEIFQPYYSNIIANFIAREVSCNYDNTVNNGDKGKIQVVELGGGRGTNACK